MTESHITTPHHTTPHHTTSNQSHEHMQDASNDNLTSFKVGTIQSKSLLIYHTCLFLSWSRFLTLQKLSLICSLQCVNVCDTNVTVRKVVSFSDESFRIFTSCEEWRLSIPHIWCLGIFKLILQISDLQVTEFYSTVLYNRIWMLWSLTVEKIRLRTGLENWNNPYRGMKYCAKDCRTAETIRFHYLRHEVWSRRLQNVISLDDDNWEL